MSKMATQKQEMTRRLVQIRQARLLFLLGQNMFFDPSNAQIGVCESVASQTYNVDPTQHVLMKSGEADPLPYMIVV